MPDAVLVDPKYPTRASTLKPVRGWLDDAGGGDVVPLAVLVSIYVEGGRYHASMERYRNAILV
jgi:hypothetical protein